MANTPHKFKSGIAVNGTATVNADTVVTETATQTLTGKSIDGLNNTLTNIPNSALATGIDAAKIADGSVSNDEFQYLDGVTSAIQDQLDLTEKAANKNAANGYAGLDANSKILSSQLPAIAITEVFVAADITARDALTVGSGAGEIQEGDVVIVTDASDDANITAGAASYIYDGAAYQLLKAGDEVLSVNGQTGVVTLSAADVNAANQTLSNLTASTSVNQDLLPSADKTRDLGSSSRHWRNFYASTITASTTTASQALALKLSTSNGDNFFEVRGKDSTSMPSGTQVMASIGANNLAPSASTPHVGLYTVTNGNASSSSPTGKILLETGNITDAGSTGVTGDVSVRTGTNAGSGARGKVILDGASIDASSKNIINVANPVAAQDAATKDYVDSAVGGASTASAGDISETSFAAANNVTAPANVTGLAFAAGVVRSFEALVSVEIDATADLFEVFTIRGIQKGAGFDISVSSTGDVSNVDFTITSGGQIQYVSGNEAGFVSSAIKFRAITTSI